MDDFGFSIFEDVLSHQECESLEKSFYGVDSNRGRAGARNLMSNAAIWSVANGARFLRLATAILGEHAVPFRATLFDKSHASNWHALWHQDRALPLLTRVESAEWGPWSMKAGVLYALAPAWAMNRVVALRLSIDASTNSNGPLSVIPGSHKLGVMSSSEIRRVVNAGSPTVCIVGRGGVMAMRPLLLHSSRKASGNARRRVLHIEYANSLDLGSGVQLRVA